MMKFEEVYLVNFVCQGPFDGDEDEVCSDSFDTRKEAEEFAAKWSVSQVIGDGFWVAI